MKPSERSLATVLFTDIVGSTERATELGDSAWRRLLEDHHDRVRRELRRFGGHEVNTAGDGFLAIFERPAMAIACAAAIRDAVRALSLEVRCGIHMGEVEIMEVTMSGIGVHIAARVMAEAGPGDVLVSRSVRDAVEGSGFGFEDRGARSLRGVAGTWRLFAATSVPADVSEALPVRQGRDRWHRRTGPGRSLVAGIIGALLILGGLYVALKTRTVNPVETSSNVPPPANHWQVTFTGDAQNPAISPDGKTIAYTTRSDGAEMRLMIQDLTGRSEPAEIARFRENVHKLRWSPTGSTLLVVVDSEDWYGRTHLVSVLGNSIREVSIGGFDAWSPDGKRLVGLRNSIKRLQFIDPATSDTSSIRLPDSFPRMTALDWSSNGQWIALKLAPERWAIWMIHVDGSRVSRLVEDDRLTWSSSIRWAPSGDGVYYVREKEEAAELVRVDVSPTTGESASPPRVVLSGLVLGGSFDLSNDGKRLLYARALSSTNLSLVSLSESGTPEARQITTGTMYKGLPSISPDGRRIAIALGRPRSNLYLMPLEGGAMKQLTFFEDATVAKPAWSPDGREIAFALTQGVKRKVGKIAAVGGPTRVFSKTDVGETATVRWAPGREILYQRPGNRNFHRLDPETGAERPLVDNESVGWMFEPQYSPDGMRVAVHWNRKPLRGIWVISLKDGQQTPLGGTRGALTPVGWSPRGDSVYAFDRPLTPDDRDYGIVRFPLAGRPQELFTIECGDSVVDVVMTPDARQFLCLGEESQSDLWVAESFDPGAEARSASLLPNDR